MAAIRLYGISKRFGATPVLRDVSLEVGDGEFVALVGPSGCGKSTLLRVIAGLEHADAGSIEIGRRAVDSLPPKERDVAMVFQSYALYPYMTVFENIALPLVMRRLNRWQRLPAVGRFVTGARAIQSRIADDVRAVAAALDIAHLLDRKPAQLSGGQRQRVALARAMVRHPQAFLMDEPLSNLDANLRVQMRAEIAQLHRRLGATFVYVTHDQAEAMTMSHRVAVMMEGRILQVDSPQKLYADPQDLRVAEFIGSPRINLLPASVRHDGALEALGVTVALRAHAPAGSRVTLGLRPEAVEVVRPDSRDALRGALVHAEHLGAESILHVGLDGLPSTVVTRADPDLVPDLRIGSPVGLRPRLDKALVFDAAGRRVRASTAAAREAVHV